MTKLATIEARMAEVQPRITVLAEAEDLTDEQRTEWDALTTEWTDLEGRHATAKKDDELRSRVAAFAASPAHVEDGDGTRNAGPAGNRKPNPYARGVERGEPSEVRAAAFQAIDGADIEARDKAGIERTLRRIDGREAPLARHIVVTGRPEYRSAFAKFIQRQEALLTDDERRAVGEVRAMGLTDAAGGYAVPFTLDPTLIDLGVHDGAYHTWRQLATVTRVLGDTWNGVAFTGVSASMVGEATEATDGSPTLTQPTISVKKAQAFVPFSIEIDQDYAALQGELRLALELAKGELEDSQFTTGSGSGNNVQGLVTGLVAATTPIVASSTANAIVAADVYLMENALGQRFRRGASWLMGKTIANVIRQLDTSGGGQMWERIGAATPAQLLGYPVHDAGHTDVTYGSGENYVAVLGDIAQAYRIVDRVGMVVDLIPHLFGTTNNYPTGQRGLYAYWRFGAGVVNATAAKVLNVT